MASLRGVFDKTPGAWTAAKTYDDGSGDYYLQGGKWQQADSIAPPQAGQATFLAKLGPGQVLGIATGGVYAVDAPSTP